ncbi:MAG: SulP family inorganic anion transporter, partial [Balneolaceae bacterium]|nr:SulP family inorganic anion transporter [Balneolaceae bacterium]
MKLGKIYSWILSKLTILRWFPDYERSTLKGDLVAGLTVGVMLIPQGMAYAVLAGIPAVYGLYASLVPLLIYPLFGTSKQLSVGIVAIDMLIVSAGISLIAEPGSTRFIQLVMLLTIVVGITQVAMSIARLGFIVNLLSKPVILGFTAAAPIIISFTQLQNLSGVELPQSQHIYVVATAFFSHTEAVHPLTLGIGLTGIVMLFLLKNFSPRTPRSLILILLSAVIVWSADLQREGVEIVGS